MSLTLTVGNDCLLQGFSSELEKELKERLTIDNPQYTNAKKYGRWVGKKLQPKLKYYQPAPGGVRFPRGFANRSVVLCREMEGQDPEIIDKRRLLEEVDFHFIGKLRPYQQVAVKKAAQRSFGVIEAGTGSGKTVIALAIIACRRQPTLVLVHTRELLYQWQQRALEFLGVETGLVGDGNFELKPLTIAIVNTARKRVAELVPQFGQLIVDECHRVPASLFTDVVSVFDSHFLLGLSATAFRSEGEMTRLIYWFLGDRIHEVLQEELVAVGAILAPEVIRRSTPFSFRYTGDYQALIKALVVHQGRNIMILNDILKILREPDSGTILVVSDRLNHCEFFERKLREAGANVALLSGRLPTEARAAVVDAVRGGEVRVLVATLQLIGEGFDCPDLSTLFLCTPIRFEGRLLQVIGRVMRPAQGKRARVFDYVDENIPTLMRSGQARALVLSRL
ncbi:DEAD/DEAH box helicase [Desulforhopalus vacuolatus]|uniref:DEAD/DEAH box helicase n=1 Tax=Desulforhopalus vacuolatus TaxID=40414 RepID=UPI0019658CE5|nr:DEAD/DEAH box helicase [Desulforhopalus vacuolatus]MBM9520893.1 DEAD/DEAH box helicase [Desulforhopalus vacuolatus]